MSYAELLERKTQLDGDHGFAPEDLPEFLFDFQRDLVEWALRKGRAAEGRIECILGPPTNRGGTADTRPAPGTTKRGRDAEQA